MKTNTKFWIALIVGAASAGLLIMKPGWYNGFFTSLPDLGYVIIIIISFFLTGRYYLLKNKLNGNDSSRGAGGDYPPASFVQPQRRFKQLPQYIPRYEEKPRQRQYVQRQREYIPEKPKRQYNFYELPKTTRIQTPQERPLDLRLKEAREKFYREEKEKYNVKSPEFHERSNEDLLDEIILDKGGL